VETGVVHSVDVSSIEYTSLEETAEGSGVYVLAANALALSFLASDTVIDYFHNGYISVYVKTQSFPFGVVFGNSKLTSTRSSYGILEIVLMYKGVIDIHVEGNVMTYSLNLTNLTSPIHEILFRYNNNIDLDDSIMHPEVMLMSDGTYTSATTASTLLVDKKIDYLLEENVMVYLTTEVSYVNGQTVEASGVATLLYIESKTAILAMNANLNGDTDAWGGMDVDINGNTVQYNFEMSGFYSAAMDGDNEITSVTFHYSEDHGSSVETHYVHELNLEVIRYTAGELDVEVGKYLMFANLTEVQSFMISDDVVDLLASLSVSVTVVTKTQTFGELFGPVRYD
jgi:hypothetical protein